ncbi:cupin domain-containing protein [Flavobacterium sp. JP2137]|uniref:cupin domain-containing protein n=1 Tax=Flavobacterium sp. JP2137 TaxID=3414510 RepID=UPI003D2FDC6D
MLLLYSYILLHIAYTKIANFVLLFKFNPNKSVLTVGCIPMADAFKRGKLKMKKMKIDKINPAAAAADLKDFWTLKSLGQINDHAVQLIKMQGEYEWHTHEKEDKLFFVVDGILQLQFRDHTLQLYPNECIIVPKGVENKPSAKDQATLMIFEPQR